MEHKLATAERKVLVQLVKLVQQRGLEGEKGGWKEFLDFHDKKFGSNLSDPSRRANDVLIAFLMTFKKKEDLQLFARVLQLDANRDLIERFKEESPDKETPEQRLVRMTIGHYTYPADYSFPSYAEDWFVSEMGKKKSKVMKSTRMVAIDCEMVTCDDGNEAVVRVGAVDRDLNVILDKFVKPDKPVINYKTDITGVTAEDLERATLTVADIQKKLRRFLSKGTILVGHSLNKDLNVLKIDHARVIDTANVFKFSNPTIVKKPSLNYLCKLVLGHEVRKDNTAHNCVHDAVAAMKIVLAVVEKGIDTSIPESEEILEKEKLKKEAEKKKLLLHRIPHYVRSQELQEVITGDFTIDVKPSKKPGVYSAVVVFKSPEEANQAFENFDGRLSKDKSGLPQKLVKFKFSSGSEAELYVRKNVQDGEISATTTARTEENNVSEETREANVNHTSEEMLEAETTRLENEKKKLLLHKIPQNVSSQEIQGAITGEFTLDIMPSKKRGFYTAVAIFNSPEEANQAFENVNGELAKDRMGLPQKLAKFKFSSGSEAELYVRKMVQDGEISATTRVQDGEISATTRPRTDENNDSEKTIEANVNHDEEMTEAETTTLENEKTKLLLHKIPQIVSSQELQGVVTGKFTLDIMPHKKRGGYYSAVTIFNSPEEANQAFENVKGELAKDRMGLPQKLAKIKLSSGSEASLYVRKMVQDGIVSATKRARPEENNVSSKRQKREDNSEDYLKEIEELKQKLKAKDSVKSSDEHLKEVEEPKQKLKAKDSVKSSDEHLKEVEELKQKLKAKEFQIQTQDKMIENLKKKLEMKSKTR